MTRGRQRSVRRCQTQSRARLAFTESSLAHDAAVWRLRDVRVLAVALYGQRDADRL